MDNCLRAVKLSHYVTSHPGLLSLAIPPESVNEYQLYRNAPLRKPNRGERLSPQSPGRRVYDFFGLVYFSLFNCIFVLSSGPT